jgi:hypothetical protein
MTTLPSNDPEKVEKWASFHLYIPIERALDEDVSAIRNVIRNYGGKLNYIEDIECPEYVLDEE